MDISKWGIPVMLCEVNKTRCCAYMSLIDALHLFDLGQRSELKAEWRRLTRGTSMNKFGDIPYIPFSRGSPLRPSCIGVAILQWIPG